MAKICRLPEDLRRDVTNGQLRTRHVAQANPRRCSKPSNCYVRHTSSQTAARRIPEPVPLPPRITTRLTGSRPLLQPARRVFVGRLFHHMAQRLEGSLADAMLVALMWGLRRTRASSPKVTTSMTSPVKTKSGGGCGCAHHRVCTIRGAPGHATPCLRVNVRICISSSISFGRPRECTATKYTGR